MEYNLIIKDFGKIKEANIHVSPLTLFVGDNNSGKSYILSLVWALKDRPLASILISNREKLTSKAYYKLTQDLKELYDKLIPGQNLTISFKNSDMISILNELLSINKNRFVQNIFNDESAKIGSMEIHTKDKDWEIKVKVLKSTSNEIYIESDEIGTIFLSRIDYISFIEIIFESTFLYFLGKIPYPSIYLPAARTGFMLAKNVINKVGRGTAFRGGILGNYGETINPSQTFTSPILNFLDTLESLSKSTKNDKYIELVKWIEKNMSHGSVVRVDNPSQEIRYVPAGIKESISLRMTSAVVTELAPLVLILKNRVVFKTLCYEEPEMCLHPQLQAQMGKLLIRLVNTGVNVAATTHSDIILQHVNNMCRLSRLEKRKELMDRFDLVEEDLIDTSQISVYQFKDCGDYSTVEEIKPDKNGFEVPTFVDALMDILEQTTDIQDADIEQGE